MRVVNAAVFGILATLLLFGLATVAAQYNHLSIAHGLFWQNALLQSLAPLGNIGTAEHPVYEGTPLNFLAFGLSFPLGFAAYGFIAFRWLRGRRSEA